MVRGFGVLLVVGIVLAFVARSRRARRVAGACARRGRAPARGARVGRGLRSAWRGAGRAAAREPAARGRVRRRRSRAAGAALRSATPTRGACSASAWSLAARRLGARHADAASSPTSEARAAEPRRAARPAGAREVDGRGRRDRRGGRRRRPDRSRRRRVDERYQQRLLKRFGYTRRAAAARPSCARPSRCPTCSAAAARRARHRHRGAARRRAAVLLPGRDHPRPPHRDAGVRHPPDAARRAAARDRHDARASSPARGRAAPSSPGCRCSPPRPTRAIVVAVARALQLLAGLLAVALVLLVALRKRARARWCRSCRSRWPPAGRRSCCSCADPAEPDVGHARRAGDRDLDRVQRAAQRALPPGARAPATSRPRRCARTYALDRRAP